MKVFHRPRHCWIGVLTRAFLTFNVPIVRQKCIYSQIYPKPGEGFVLVVEYYDS